MAEAILTLSQRPSSDHTADDFTVGRRVKAHPATDTFMRGDVYGTIDFISRGPKRLVHVKMDRSGTPLRGQNRTDSIPLRSVELRAPRSVVTLTLDASG
jgi:hypothetical protein